MGGDDGTMGTSPIESHLRAAEQRLVAALQLRPRALPPSLAEAVGRWKDEPVRLATRAYEGDAIALLRIASVSGVQLTLGSLLAMPRPNRPVPILGAELSWSGARDETTVLADLTPVRDALEREAELRAIARVVPDVSGLPSAPELPRWRGDWDSSLALATRVRRARQPEALAAFDGYVEGFATLAAAASPSAERAYQIRALHEGYLSARRGDESLGILGAIFGKAWAEEYVRRVLFPVV